MVNEGKLSADENGIYDNTVSYEMNFTMRMEFSCESTTIAHLISMTSFEMWHFCMFLPGLSQLICISLFLQEEGGW